MHILLNILANQYPTEFSQQWIQENFTQEQFLWLIKVGILVKAQPKQNVACPSCDDFHPLLRDDQGYYCICNSYFSGREDVPEEIVTRWRLSPEGIAAYLAHELEISPDTSEILEDLIWRIGREKYQNSQFYLALGRREALEAQKRLEKQSLPVTYLLVKLRWSNSSNKQLQSAIFTPL